MDSQKLTKQNYKYNYQFKSQEPQLSSKQMPQALEAEKAVLGALLIDKDALTKVIDILSPESFYKEAHQHIYKAIQDLFSASEPVDILTVMHRLRENGTYHFAGESYYIVKLTNTINSAVNIETHARIILEMAIKRELIKVSDTIIKSSYEHTTDVFELLDEAQQHLFDISEQNIKKNYADMRSIMVSAIQELEAKKDRKDGLTGVPAGFTALDRVTAGWQKADLVILAARPAMGKTAFSLSALRNAAVDHQMPVAIFSLEMSSVQLVNRLISSEASLESEKLKTGNLTDSEWQTMVEKTGQLIDAPIFIDDTPALSVLELRAKCRRLKAQSDIQLIIVDYLQLMVGDANKGGNREQEIASISRALKQIAKELDVPVIALSQLSRAVETRGGDKRPQLSDLRESGCLTGDTLIPCPETGKSIPIQQLTENNQKSDFQIFGLDENYKIDAHKAVKAFYSGKKKVYELQTQSGRKIKASANHPFLKLSGWTRLDDLRKGDRIAVPKNLPEPDVIWDEIKSITELGIEDVYDITVEHVHNFVANDIIVHNSIEQDADMVLFLYRPEYYGITEDMDGNPTTGVGEVIIAKHRNGSLGTVQLKFIGQYTRFMDLDAPDDFGGGNDFDMNYGNAFKEVGIPEEFGTVTVPSKINEEYKNDGGDEVPF